MIVIKRLAKRQLAAGRLRAYSELQWTAVCSAVKLFWGGSAMQNQIETTVAGLNRLARNLWWTWNQDAQDIFEELSPRAWRNLYHLSLIHI